MCLIMYREKDQEKLSDEFIKDVHTRNNDGWGILYHENPTRVAIKRGMTLEEFNAAYRELEEQNHEMVVHFRMATHGNKTLEMTHPFEIGENIYLMHNGVFKLDVPKEVEDKGFSDTAYFAEHIIKPMLRDVRSPSKFIRSEAFKVIMDDFCDKHNSRLVIYDVKGPVFFSGWFQTSKKMWVSNQYAFTVDNPAKKNTSYHYGTGYANGYGNNYSSANTTTTKKYTPPEYNPQPAPYAKGWHEGYHDVSMGITYDTSDWGVHGYSDNVRLGEKTTKQHYIDGYRDGYSRLYKQEFRQKNTSQTETAKKITEEVDAIWQLVETYKDSCATTVTSLSLASNARVRALCTSAGLTLSTTQDLVELIELGYLTYDPIKDEVLSPPTLRLLPKFEVIKE